MTEFLFESRSIFSLPNGWSPREVLAHFLASRHAQSDDPFFSIDLGLLIELVRTWRRLFPRVRPFYAVKCNPDPLLLAALDGMGVGFDCASKGEIQTVLGVNSRLAQGPTTRIIYANPCKQLSHIKYARQQGVNLATFDNASELHKHATLHQECRLVVRIAVDDSSSLCKLSNKFGCDVSTASQLLQLAKELSLEVVGVSFHVGSGCMDGEVFRNAIRDSRLVFNAALDHGYRLTLLDIGGGFPACPGSRPSPALSFMESLSDVINSSLGDHFSDWPGLEIISEPGRYFAGCSHSLAVSVTACRHVHGPEEESAAMMYYVNEGVYGAFNCILFDHQNPEPRLLSVRKPSKLPIKSSVWGPTCDGLDQILREAQLPLLSVGDWLYFEQMGAYTRASRSDFNGFAAPANYYYASADLFPELCTLLTSSPLPLTSSPLPLTPSPLPATPELPDTEGADSCEEREGARFAPYPLQAEGIGLIVSAIS